MKIYNTNQFEKLNINQINLNDLNNMSKDFSDINIEKIDNLYKIKYKDLKTGWIVKTYYENSWMIFNAGYVYEVFGNEEFRYHNKTDLVMVGKFVYQYNDNNKLDFFHMHGYKRSFPKNHVLGAIFDIIEIYKTDIDINIFRYQKQFEEFYIAHIQNI